MLTDQRLKEWEKTLFRLRCTLLQRDTAGQEKAQRLIGRIKQHCEPNWRARQARLTDNLLDRWN